MEINFILVANIKQSVVNLVPTLFVLQLGNMIPAGAGMIPIMETTLLITVAITILLMLVKGE